MGRGGGGRGGIIIYSAGQGLIHHYFYSEDPSQTTQMRRLIWAFTVGIYSICTPFPMAKLKLTFDKHEQCWPRTAFESKQSTVLSTSHGKNFFAWSFILNENILF